MTQCIIKFKRERSIIFMNVIVECCLIVNRGHFPRRILSGGGVSRRLCRRIQPPLHSISFDCNIVYCRYIREWLGLMVVSRIVDIDGDTKKYLLPRHRRATLCIAPPGGYLGIQCWAIPMNGAVLDTLMECFKMDGPRGKALLNAEQTC